MWRTNSNVKEYYYIYSQCIFFVGFQKIYLLYCVSMLSLSREDEEILSLFNEVIANKLDSTKLKEICAQSNQSKVSDALLTMFEK